MNIFKRFLDWLIIGYKSDPLQTAGYQSEEAITPAIYDPINYPEKAKLADDYITFHDATGVTADKETKLISKLKNPPKPKNKTKKTNKKKIIKKK